MLAHSPPLPLVVDYGDEDRQVAPQDEEGILLVFQRRRRVRRIQLRIPTSNFRKLVVALDGEFPVLEDLCIEPLNANGECLVLPETFNAPHLRRFALRDVTYFPGLLHLPPPASCVEPAERVGQCTRCCGSQLWRYVPFYYVYWFVADLEHGPRKIGHCGCLSTSSTMIRFSTYSITVDRVRSSKREMAIFGGIGARNGGGSSSRRSAEDGGASSLVQHPTCVSASFVQLVLP
jgi:hypothetical protein